MISSPDFIHLPYSRDLTDGGIANALRSVPYTYNRMGGSPYDRLRYLAAGVAVELAFRRYLSEQNTPFDVKGATPFTEPDRYDAALGGRRCGIKSFLITYREQIAEMNRNPEVILNAPALVPSAQNTAEGHSDKDIYLFAFLSGPIAASMENIQKAIHKKQPVHLVHVMPDAWMRPTDWKPLGKLVLKSESAETQIVEVKRQDEGREMRTVSVELPPVTRVQLDENFFTVAHIQSKSLPDVRIRIHSPARKETYLINLTDWATSGSMAWIFFWRVGRRVRSSINLQLLLQRAPAFFNMKKPAQKIWVCQSMIFNRSQIYWTVRWNGANENR